jgi:hypothetical protein
MNAFDDRCGSDSTELAKATSPFMSAMPSMATKAVSHSETSRCAIRVINAVQQISTGLRSYLGLWSVRWHTRASAALR